MIWDKPYKAISCALRFSFDLKGKSTFSPKSNIETMHFLQNVYSECLSKIVTTIGKIPTITYITIKENPKIKFKRSETLSDRSWYP